MSLKPFPPNRTTAQSPGRPRRADAILTAAADIFLEAGYLGSSMDEIALRAGVSKQTVYKHFESKERLFVEVVIRMTGTAGDEILASSGPVRATPDVDRYLYDYALRQLMTVMTPRLMQLRRLVIAEVSRFPDLARVLYEGGPQRAQTELASMFLELHRLGELRIGDPAVAASQFNWLVMAEPVNRAMLLGDTAIPSPQWLKQHVEAAVRVFLAAYRRQDPATT